MRILIFLSLVLAAPALANYNGTVIGAPAFGPAKFANGLIECDGNDAITLPSGIVNFGSTANWTIEAWVQTTSTGTQVFLGSSTASNPMWFGSSSGNFVISIPGSGGFGPGILTTSGVINDGRWHHIAVSMTAGTSVKAFVDGLLAGTFTGIFTSPGANPAAIGYFYNSGFAWTGVIDELAFWDSAKYTTAFTPPTAAYTGSESTLRALYHLQADGTDSKASAAFSLSPNSVNANRAGNTITVTGAFTAWTSGTTFSATAGTITAQSVNVNTQVATLTYTAPATGPVTISDSTGLYTANLSVNTSTAIAMDNAALIYSPYNWVVTSGTASTVCSGAYFRTIFSGTSVALATNTANNGAPYSQLWARIDNDSWIQLTLSAGNPVLSIATGLQNRNHLVEVIVKSTSETLTRWISTSSTMVTITGIVLDAGASVTAPARRTKNILVFGDSITEGVRAKNNTATNDTDRNDVLGDYSYALTTAVDAEVGIVGFGGSGINQSGSGGYPALTSAYNFISYGVARSFSPAPDLVVYLEGQNDSTNITGGFETVVQGILAAAPYSKHLLLSPLSQNRSSDIQAAVLALANPNVIFQDTTGWFNSSNSSDGLHPYDFEHIGHIAPHLFPIVEGLLYPRRSRSVVTVQ